MNELDHPLIIVAQAILAVAMYRLFFAVRRTSQPLPMIIGGLAISITVCLGARIKNYDWFFVSDIAQYCLWAASTIASTFTVLHRKQEESKRPGAPIVVPDFFDRISIRATWIAGILIGGLVVYAYVKAYFDKKEVSTQVASAAQVAYAAATEEYTQQQAASTEVQDSILTAIASISATQGTLLANQSSVLKNQEFQKKQTEKNVKNLKKTIQTTVVATRPMEPTKPKIQEDEKPNLWQRAKGLFKSKSAKPDDDNASTGAIQSDTVAVY